MRLSVEFVKRKHEALFHLKANIFSVNQALAKNQFPTMMNKIIVEMKGNIIRKTFVRPDGKQVSAKVIEFSDGSFASLPKLWELTGGRTNAR
jgi:hypothetical protein